MYMYNVKFDGIWFRYGVVSLPVISNRIFFDVDQCRLRQCYKQLHISWS